MIEPRPVLLTAKEVGEILRLGQTATYRLIEGGEIATLRVGPGGRALRVTEAALAAYLRRCESPGR